MSNRKSGQKRRDSVAATVSSCLSRNPRAISNVLSRVITLEGNVTSNGGGVINGIFSLNPSGIGDFTTLAPLYDEMRFLGGQMKFFCAQQNSLTVSSVPITVVYDNDDATTALTTYGNALDYQVKKQFASVWDNQSFPTLRFHANPLTTSNGPPWYTTGAPNTYPRSVKVYATGGTASTTYCQYTLEMVFEFRGST
jgi:hypothetical protein